MLGDKGIAFFVGLGAAMWVYQKFAHRATGGEYIKNIIPALLAGLVVFVLTLSLLTAIF